MHQINDINPREQSVNSIKEPVISEEASSSSKSCFEINQSDVTMRLYSDLDDPFRAVFDKRSTTAMVFENLDQFLNHRMQVRMGNKEVEEDLL